jgi:acid phosphatase (class A)
MRKAVIFFALCAGAATMIAAEEQRLTSRAAMNIIAMPTGYLGPAKLPDALLLIPRPPAPGSAAEARDEEAQKAALAERGTPRWGVATSDADLFTPQATGALSCAAGIVISPKETPGIDHLLRRSFADLGLSTSAVKRKYQRQRPFMVNGQPSCTPDWEPILRKDGAYPSGHSAVGYGWGLILAELIPDRAAQLVARGRAFGDSRRICNVHWLSDVEEGRVAAAAVVAKLHSEAAFLADMKAAKAEIAKASPPTRDCAKEAGALAVTP